MPNEISLPFYGIVTADIVGSLSVVDRCFHFHQRHQECFCMSADLWLKSELRQIPSSKGVRHRQGFIS
jgi:hypothetical protein